MKPIVSAINLENFVANKTRLEAGDRVRLQVELSEAVTVNTFGGSRVPVLALNTGGMARYVGGSGSDTLVFEYFVQESDNSTRLGDGLRVIAISENDAEISSLADPQLSADVTIRKVAGPVGAANDVVLTPSGSEEGAQVSVFTATSTDQIDLVPPKWLSSSSVSGVYNVGDALELTLTFNEVVRVDASQGAGLPTLGLLSGGELLPVVASYAGGSGTKSLRFRYEVAEGDPVAGDINIASFDLNGGRVTDLSGNVADVAIVAGQNDLLSSVDIAIAGDGSTTSNPDEPTGPADTTAPVINNVVCVNGDDTFVAGDVLTFELKLSESVTVDASSGVPMLILSNGGIAIYEGGSGSDVLRFRYAIQASDRNATELTVLGVAENDAAIVDAAGNAADVRINTSNNLDVSNQVQISAQAPYVRTIESADGIYQPGDEITFEVLLSEAVSVAGTPGLDLSNGATASYVSGTGTDTLVFSYTVAADASASSADLDVSGLQLTSGSLLSVSSGNEVSRVLRPGILARTKSVEIDATPPEGTIEIDAQSLSKGDSATVTLTFSEPVANPLSAIEVNGGTLDNLVTDETSEPGTVWKGTFRPSQDIEISANTLILDNTKVMDNPPADFGESQDPSIWTFGNYGVGLSQTQPFAIDTKSPVAEISSELLPSSEAIANRLITLNFGESVSGLTENALVVSGGRKVPGSFTALTDGVYQLVVEPLANSGTTLETLDFGVGLLANSVTDMAGNSNVQLAPTTFTWDETAPVIEVIEGESGSYVTGDVVSLKVTFDEKVFVETPAGGSVPSLALTNGALAHYAAGSGSKVLRFDYVVSAGDEATDLGPLALFEHDGTIRDASGNDARVAISSSNGLVAGTSILIDGVVPVITTMQSQDGLYTPGETVGIEVQFSEAVHVDVNAGSPILALSNGAVASYVGGSETSLLRFEYTVAAGDYDSQDLDVLGLAEEGSVITEFYGRTSRSVDVLSSSDVLSGAGSEDGYFYVDLSAVAIDDTLSFTIDGVELTTEPLSMADHAEIYSAVRTSLIAQGDALPGLDQLAIVDVEGSTYLRFANSLEPTVKAATPSLGDNVNVAIRSELNSLAYRSEVNIDSAPPAIAQVSANAGAYNAGDAIEIAVAWTKGVEIDITQGVPSLLMSNGALATYIPSLSSPAKLLFRYVIDASDAESADLSVSEFRSGNARFSGLVSEGAADLSLPSSALALDGALTIDLTPPEVVSLELSDTQLSAGETAQVSVELSEAVQQFNEDYVTASDGVLSAFVSEDGITWTATYTPFAAVSALDQVVRVNQAQLRDLSGNAGSGEFASSAYTIDSTYPEVTITSDTAGATKEPVRFVLNFSESVSGFDPSDAAHVVIEGGTLESWSVETPDNSGRPEGEYSFVVVPHANSTDPIKVRVPENVVTDSAGNGNARSLVFVQPIDTAKAFIESIDAPEGAYREGQTITFTVNYNEVVSLNLREGVSDHEMPELFLSNGQTAKYIEGSGTDAWTFEYTIAQVLDQTGAVMDIDRSPIQVLSVLENDTYLLDAVGNRTEVQVGVDHGLTKPVAVDTTGAQVAGFEAIDGYTYLEGHVVWIKMTLDEVVNVTASASGPVLQLDNGGTATYMAGSGSKTLMFRYQVSEDDAVSTDLGVSALSLGAGSIVDLAGNAMPASVTEFASNLSDNVDVAVDTKAPELTLITVVEDAGEASDVVNDGYYKAGSTVAFDVRFDDVVTVDDTSGVPQLTLNNGQVANYVEGSGTDVLRFEYTVAQDDLNRQFLEVVGLSENGGTIKDVSGNEALVEVFADNLDYTTAVVDTKAPSQTGSDDSFTANAAGVDEVREVQVVSYSFSLNEAVEFDLSSIDREALSAQTRSELGLDESASDADLAAAIAQSLTDAEQTLILSQLAVTFAGSRVDSEGVALSDINNGLQAINFRYLPDENGVISGKQFAVDVEVPDRALGDLVVSALPGALRDLATNANATVISHSQRVDTQTVDIVTTPAAGLFIGSTSTVRVKDLNGDLLSADVELDPTTGQALISVTPSERYPGGYRGPVTVEVVDTDPSPDYIDEFTGEAVTLSDGSSAYVMRAVFNVDQPGEVAVTVSPVTELAVKKLEEAMAASTETTLDAAQVDQFNAGIGKIFGVEDIVKTAATVVNSELVESSTGADVADFDSTDGINASEKYGQVLAMLSARDSQSGSLAATINELAADIKSFESGGQTTLAIRQSGADKLAAALDSSSGEAELDGAGVNRSLLDVAYIDEASADGFGLNLAEAETATVPVKGAQVGDRVFVQWGVITQPDTNAGEVAGAPNRFEVIIDQSHVQADGSIRVPVPLAVIEKQGDANEVAVSTAVIPEGSKDADGNEITAPAESDFRAPVLLTVDIIPPETSVEAPDAATPFTTVGAVEGIRAGDDLNVLLNNSADEQFKYALDTSFLADYTAAYDVAYADAAAESSEATVEQLQAQAEAAALVAIATQIPAGLAVSGIVQDAASGTWTFNWALDLTQAISVAEEAAEAAAIEAGETYTPVPTFTADDERSVFQVQASTADLVGNADADDARNEVIIGSVSDVVDSPEEQSVMDQALNRLSTRYGDASVDTRAKIKVIAEAIDGLATLKQSGDPTAVAGELTRAQQTLTLGSGGSAGNAGTVAAGVHTLTLGETDFTVDLSSAALPTVADVIAQITGTSGYEDLPYTVALDDTGDGIAVEWKAFGPQPSVSAEVAVTTTDTADQLQATISNPGGLASFAVQQIAVDGATNADGVFTPAVGDVDLAFDGVTVSASVAEGDTLADVLTALQGESDYINLPFALAINANGDGFTATWKATQATAVTDPITVDRVFEVVTTTETQATIVEAGSAGVTTQELAALDIQDVDNSELAAINRALASDLAEASAPVVSFADSALAAGEETTATLTFATRVGQIPDDVLALVGGTFSNSEAESEESDPIWSTSDGLTWTATFTAASDMPNTALSYAEAVDSDGNAVLDVNGNPVLEAQVTDATSDPVVYAQASEALSQVALTEALVNRVTAATTRVAAFAETQGATAAPQPSVQDFADMAVEGVRADNVGALNDALSVVRARFEGAGDLHTQIQTVTESYNAVFDTVYDAGTQPTAADLVEDLNNLGVSNLSSDAARAEDQTTLLQGALQAVAAAKADVTNDGSTTTAAEQQAGMIDSVAKLESFVASVERVLARANGDQAVDGNGDPVRVEVSDSDLTALGFGDLLADTDGNSRLSSLQKVLVDQSVGTGSDAVVNYADLKAMLDNASDAFDDIVGLVVAAQGSADTTNTITDATFKEMGVDGVNDVAISGIADGAEMAAVIKDALVNTADSIDSLEAIQAIVDNYTQVLSVASGNVTGADAVITNAQFANLGVTLSSDDALEPSALAELLSGIIANKASPAGGNATDNVDSISELQALADAAKKVFDSAALDADPAQENAGVLATQTDLNTLGFDTVDADNLDAIQRVLVRNAADRDAIKNYTDLKSLIDAAVDAHTALTDLVATAQGGSKPVLTGLDEADFAAMGLDDVDSSNVAAALDALSNTPNNIATAAQLQAVVDSTNVILDTASNDAGTIDKNDLTNIGITLSSGALTDNDASLTSGVIASLSSDKVNTVSEVQAIVNAIDAVFANAARATDDDTTNTVTVTKAQLLTLGFDGSGEALEVTDHNLDAIQRVLTDQANESAVASYADLRTKINDAITAHTDILEAASSNDPAGIDAADYAAMGIDDVDESNLALINDALIKSKNAFTTAASVQEVVDSYNHILELRASFTSEPSGTLVAADFTNLGVTLKATGTDEGKLKQVAYLQEIVDNAGGPSIERVDDIQLLADATSDLIDMIQEASPDSDGVTGLTPEQFALLGIDDAGSAITAAQADMLSKRLALTADNLSDVTNLATDLKGLWDAATASLAKIKAYAEDDGVSDFDDDNSFAPADADDVPTVQDYKNIGVVDYDNGSGRTAIDATNLDAINELFAATTVGADTIDSDMSATTAAEDQAVIDQGATRLQALLKIANYAQNNGVDTTTYPAPNAADFTAAGVTGVADDNNVATLLTLLRGTTSATNFAKADTAAELQAFVKQVAVAKIAKWADTDGDTVADGTGVNAVAPILQDYVNAGLVDPNAGDPNDNAITAAMVPALNELFASNAVNTDAADTDALQQGIIDVAATQLAAMAKIASYADTDGAIDLDNDAGTGDANGYDQLTVDDFEAIGVFGVGDGTRVSTGSGVNTSNITFNNLTEVLNKLAEEDIDDVDADTAAEVQALVGQVAVEKIAHYADQDGQLPLVTKTIAVTVDVKTGGGTAFYLDLDGDPATASEEAPTLDLAPGTYTFTQSGGSNDGHPLAFFLYDDKTGRVADQGITVTSTGVAGSNGVTTLVIPEGFDGPLYYECANDPGMGNSVDVAVPYFEPELQDYTNAGLKSYDGTSDVDATDVASLNEIFAGVNIGGASDSYHADDFASQQAAIVAKAAYLQAIEKIAQYAEDGNSSSLGVPTAADYDAAGIVGVYDSNNNGGVTGTPSNISVINQAILDDTASFTDANTAVEIQVIVSRGRITHYANTNGLDDQATPAPLAAALVPTVADYANVGVTEIYDGSSLVAIDKNNLEQLNDLMAMRYVGDPDADGDGSTAADGDADERVDVVDNTPNAATNKTNLSYAGTVNTAEEIQEAVALAMGVATVGENNVVGLRAVALDKIAAFTQAVSVLTDRDAYDIYIADSNNAAVIPSAQDYNNAGVLGLSDSTESITTEFATVINATLFRDNADVSVNTAVELQPFVDSVLSAFGKIVNYGTGATEPVPTAQDYDLIGITGVAGPGGLIEAYSNIALVNQAVSGQVSEWSPTLDDIEALVGPAILLAKVEQFQLFGETLNESYGDLFNYTSGPRDQYGGIDSADFKAGLVQGAWTETADDNVTSPELSEVQNHFDINEQDTNEITRDGGNIDFWNITTDPYKPAIVGWQDTKGYYVNENLLQSVRVHQRDDNWEGAPGRMPSTFDVEGFNAKNGQWELIKHFEKEPLKDKNGNTIPLTTLAKKTEIPDFQTYEVNASKPYDGYRITVTENLEVAGGSTVTYSGAGTMFGVNEVSFMVQNSSRFSVKPVLADYLIGGLSGVTEELVNAMNTLVVSGYREGVVAAEGDGVQRHVIKLNLADMQVNSHSYELVIGDVTLTSDELVNEGLQALLSALQSDADYASAPFTIALSGNDLEITWKDVGAQTASAALSQLEFTTIAGIETVISEAAAIQSAAYDLISDYVDDNDNTLPSAVDYYHAGYNGVTDQNLYSVNQAFVSLSALPNFNEGKAAVTTGLSNHLAAIALIDDYAGSGSSVPTYETYKLAGINNVPNHYVGLVNDLIQTRYSKGDIDDFATLSSAVTRALAPVETFLNDRYRYEEPTTVNSDSDTLAFETAAAKLYRLINQDIGDDAAPIGLTPADLSTLVNDSSVSNGNLANFVARLQSNTQMPYGVDQLNGVLSTNAYINYLQVKADGSLNGLASYSVLESGARQIEGQSKVDFIRINLVEAVAGDIVSVFNGTTSIYTTTLSDSDVALGFVDTSELDLVSDTVADGHATLKVVVERASSLLSTSDNWEFTYGTSTEALALITAAAENNSATATYPSVGDYITAGVTDVDKWNLGAINSSLNSAQIGSGEVSSATDIQAIVDAWTLVLNPDDRITDANEVAFETIGLFPEGDNALESGALGGLIETMSVESIDTLTELENLIPRSVQVSGLTLSDNDEDYTNGTVFDLQTISADITGLVDTDSVFLTVGSNPPIDITAYVNDGRLDYGVSRATADLQRGSAIDGFYRYELAAQFDGGQPPLDFGLYIPDDTKLRSSAQFTSLTFDAVDRQSDGSYLVTMSLEGEQGDDEVDFQVDLNATIVEYDTGRWTARAPVGQNTYIYEWNLLTPETIEFDFFSAAPTDAYSLATVTGSSGKIYEVVLAGLSSPVSYSLDASDAVTSVTFSHVYPNIQPVDGVYRIDAPGNASTFTAKVYGSDTEVYAISKTSARYGDVPTLRVNGDEVRALSSETDTFNLVVDMASISQNMDLMTGTTELASFTDTRFTVVDGDVLEISVKDSSSADITPDSGNTIVVDINIPAPSLDFINIVTSNDSKTLDIGDTLTITADLDFGISESSPTSFELVLSNGAVVLMTLDTQDSSRRTFKGSYTVAQGDTTTTDLQIGSIRDVGSTLPSNDTGDLKTDVSGLTLDFRGESLEVTDIIPASIDSIALAIDTGLYDDDNITSEAFQYDATHGAVSGQLSPSLADDDSYAVVVDGAIFGAGSFTELTWIPEGWSTYEVWDETFSVSSVSGNGATDSYSTMPDYGLFLTKPNRIALAGSETPVAAVGDTLTMTLTVEGGSPLTLSYTVGSESNRSAEQILVGFFNDNEAAIRSAGFEVEGGGSAQDPNSADYLQARNFWRNDALAFTIDLSQQLNGQVYAFKNYSYADTLNTLTTSYIVDEGSTNVEGELTASLYTVNKATVNSLGSATSAAEQTLSVTLDGNSLNHDFRLGDKLLGDLDSSITFSSWDTSRGLIAEVNSWVSKAMSGSNIPTVILGGGSDTFGSDATAELRFVWASFSDFLVGYVDSANSITLTLVAAEEDDRTLTFTQDGFGTDTVAALLALNDTELSGSVYKFVEIDRETITGWTPSDAAVRLVRTDGKAFTANGLDTIVSSAPAAGSINVADNYGRIDYVASSLEHRTQTSDEKLLAEDRFSYELDQIAANTPSLVAATSNALSAGEGDSISVTGVAGGEYLYFISSTAYDTLTSVSSNPNQHMLEIYALPSEQWLRIRVPDNTTVSDTVTLTVDGLANDVYKLVAMDLAGNFSELSGDELTVSNSTSAANELDIELDLVNNTSDGDATTVELSLNLHEAVEGDTVEIWIDGVKFDEHILTSTEVTAGSLVLSADVDAGGADVGSDNDVDIQVALRHGSHTVQDRTEDTVVEYTWS